MHLTFDNVNDAFHGIVEGIHTGTIPTVRTNSRNGAVLQVPEPVTITYCSPTRRVLFNPVRDANCFFHMMESLWMLSGRNDVDPLAYYCGNVKQYSDDGKTFNGAYGERWRYSHSQSRPREWEGIDQLDLLVSHLKADPESRRAVLSMWNVEDDLLKVDTARDVCCNLNVMFSLRRAMKTEGRGEAEVEVYPASYLDMTVTNRSNDLLWGMLGANYTTFTILQEYMAARLGVEVGKYHHVSNNVHVYVERPDWRPVDLLSVDPFDADSYDGLDNVPLKTVPLVRDPETFEQELPEFVSRHVDGQDSGIAVEWDEPFLEDVAEPLLSAFHEHKQGFHEHAMRFCESIEAEDWRLAAIGWLKRRQERREQRGSERQRP